MNCLLLAVLKEDGAREGGETVSESHGPFGVDCCRSVGREEDGLWRVEVFNGVFSPSFDPGRRSMLLLPTAKVCSSGSVGEEGGRSILGCDEEVEGRRSGVMRSAELSSVGLRAFEGGKRDFTDEGESVRVELEDREARGMWVSECCLADENTRLDCGNCGDSARRGRLSGGGTGEPFDREDADNKFGDIEGESPSSDVLWILIAGDEEGDNLSVEPDRLPSPPAILFGLNSAAKSGSNV